jgi:hypothetical protein
MTGSMIEILSRGLVGAEARGNQGKRKRKNKNKKDNNEGVQQQIQARCVGQIPACEALAADSCGNDAACAAAIRGCCQSLGTCEFGTFITCANAAVSARN